jgi:hypothetical protein
MQSVAIDSTSPHARLRKLKVFYPVHPTPLGNGSITSESQVVSDLLMGQDARERNDRVQLGQLLNHFPMRNDDVGSVLAERSSQFTDRLPLCLNVHVGCVVGRQ